MARAGVFSFARNDPNFYNQNSEPKQQLDENNILMSMCKVITHETGHLFGLTHCIYYKCCMNGTMTGSEGARRPV